MSQTGNFRLESLAWRLFSIHYVQPISKQVAQDWDMSAPVGALVIPRACQALC